MTFVLDGNEIPAYQLFWIEDRWDPEVEENTQHGSQLPSKRTGKEKSKRKRVTQQREHSTTLKECSLLPDEEETAQEQLEDNQFYEDNDFEVAVHEAQEVQNTLSGFTAADMMP